MAALCLFEFDFTKVKGPSLYVMAYADQRTAPFPISDDADANIWQESLDHHVAEQMDHVSVREGYRMWHGASHLDDGRMAPVVGERFDGWNPSAKRFFQESLCGAGFNPKSPARVP